MNEKIKVVLEEKEIIVNVTRRRTRKLKIQIKNDNEIFFVGDYSVLNNVILDFIYKNKEWILKNIIKNLKKIENMSIDACQRKEKIWYLGKLYDIVKTTDVTKINEFDENNYYIPLTIANDKIYDNLYEQKKKIINEVFDNCYFKMKNILKEKPVLSLRIMKSRWGTCHFKKNKIFINKKVIHASMENITMVVFHELCHLVVPNHSKEFYELLKKYSPNYKTLKRELNDLSFVLKLGEKA